MVFLYLKGILYIFITALVSFCDLTKLSELDKLTHIPLLSVQSAGRFVHTHNTRIVLRQSVLEFMMMYDYVFSGVIMSGVTIV